MANLKLPAGVITGNALKELFAYCKEAKAALAMMPDMRQAQSLVKAMQGVLSSGGNAFESMQRVMGDFTRMAQQSMPGVKR